jgi:tRNA-dihydrouridine synthase
MLPQSVVVLCSFPLKLPSSILVMIANPPQHFSIHSGMGAALLKNPDNLVAILTSLVREVGLPNSLPISVKIRLLDTLEETLTLVERICSTGVCRITVHCRTTPMRPREPAIRSQLSAIASLCHKHNVQCYANGDIKSVQDAEAVMAEHGVDGAMIATAAEANPSCFRQEGLLPWKEVVDEYFRTAIEVGHYFSNTKFSVAHLVPGKAPIYQELAKTKTFEAMAGVLGVEYVSTEEDRMREPQQKVKGPKPNPPGSAKVTKSMQRSQKATGMMKTRGENAQNVEGLVRALSSSPKGERKDQGQNQGKKRTEREGSVERGQMTNNQNNQNKRQKILEEPAKRQRSRERSSVAEDMGSKMSEAF